MDQLTPDERERIPDQLKIDDLGRAIEVGAELAICINPINGSIQTRESH
jgi:hypothetical protein